MDAPEPPNPSLEEFAAFVDSVPPRLGLWRTASKAELWPLLAWLNVWSVQEMRETARDVGVVMAAKLRHAELHNTVGLGVVWLLSYLRDNPAARGSGDRERAGFARRAGQVWSIRDLVQSARAGVYEFSADEFNLHFEFAGDVSLEALDNMLEVLDELWRAERMEAALQNETKSAEGSLRERLTASGINVPWEAAPDDLRVRFRRRAHIVSEQLRRIEVPRDAQIGGFSFGDAVAVWEELLAGASYRQACLLLGAQHPLVACPTMPFAALVEQLAPCNVSSTCIGEVLQFLTFDVQRDADPCLAPVIPVMGQLTPLSSLITPGAPDRNILARLRSDPSRFGGVGAKIGRIGTATVAEGIRRVPDVTVATEVKVLNRNGGTAGDLDVVAIDTDDALVAVFEVKWQLEPDGATEIDKVERQASEGQSQLARLSAGLADGSFQVRWPSRHPHVSGFQWKWFVITSNVIPVVRGSRDGIFARSHRVLSLMALRKGASLREVCDVLTNPPIPPTAREDSLELSKQRFWSYEISVRRPR